jgi:hypothetical protein
LKKGQTHSKRTATGQAGVERRIAKAALGDAIGVSGGRFR